MGRVNAVVDDLTHSRLMFIAKCLKKNIPEVAALLLKDSAEHVAEQMEKKSGIKM